MGLQYVHVMPLLLQTRRKGEHQAQYLSMQVLRSAAGPSKKRSLWQGRISQGVQIPALGGAHCGDRRGALTALARPPSASTAPRRELHR